MTMQGHEGFSLSLVSSLTGALGNQELLELGHENPQDLLGPRGLRGRGCA